MSVTADLIARLRGVLEPVGASAEDRDAAVLWALQAELLALPRFGVGMLLRELARVGGRPAVIEPTPPGAAVSELDAAGILGVLALARSTRYAEQAVSDHGVGIVGLRNVGATGILGLPARRLAAQGLVGIVVAESGPFVAPWGGSAPAIGTNPIAIAVPREGEAPLVVDFATSPLTVAEVRRRGEAGETLPPGVALDADGQATVDPDATVALLPDSRVASLAGLFVQLLAGVATGGSPPTRTRWDGLRGVTVLAFRPASSGIAKAAVDLATEWRAAGGHVPARLDTLPARLDDLPPQIDLPRPSLDALLAAAQPAP